MYTAILKEHRAAGLGSPTTGWIRAAETLCSTMRWKPNHLFETGPIFANLAVAGAGFDMWLSFCTLCCRSLIYVWMFSRYNETPG